jgi:hypothetical protein
MKDEMSDFYEAYLKKQRRKKARQDFMEKLKGAFIIPSTLDGDGLHIK